VRKRVRTSRPPLPFLLRLLWLTAPFFNMKIINLAAEEDEEVEFGTLSLPLFLPSRTDHALSRKSVFAPPAPFSSSRLPVLFSMMQRLFRGRNTTPGVALLLLSFFPHAKPHPLFFFFSGWTVLLATSGTGFSSFFFSFFLPSSLGAKPFPLDQE